MISFKAEPDQLCRRLIQTRNSQLERYYTREQKIRRIQLCITSNGWKKIHVPQLFQKRVITHVCEHIFQTKLNWLREFSSKQPLKERTHKDLHRLFLVLVCQKRMLFIQKSTNAPNIKKEEFSNKICTKF